MSAGQWKVPTRRDQIVRIVTSRPGIVAADVALAMGISCIAADAELNRLAQLGRIVKHGQRSSIRWSAVGVEVPAVKVKRKPATKPAKPGALLVVPGGTVSPPAARMPKPAAQPIITSATRVTVAPKPLPRFHVPDDFRGAFSLAGVGRDVQTGRGWA